MKTAEPGDLILVRTIGGSWSRRLAGWIIRLGSGLSDSPNVWNHVIIMHHVDEGGTPWGVEGRPGGVGWVDVRPWLADQWTITNVDQPKSDEQRSIVCDGAHALLGAPYDWTGIAADAGRAISPLWRRTAGVPWPDNRVPGQVVCSALADWLYEHAGLASPPSDRWCTPADWATLILGEHW